MIGAKAGTGGGAGLAVPVGASGSVLTTASSFDTSFGNRYLAVAVSRHAGIGEWDLGDRLDVRGMTLERAGGRERDCRVLVGLAF